MTTSSWADTGTPEYAQWNDSSAVELGVRFTVGFEGTIDGITYYKHHTNLGPHTGTLWTAEGLVLAQVEFENESLTLVGWSTQLFDEPVAVEPETEYVASYHTPYGNYATNPSKFWSNGFGAGDIVAAGGGGGDATNGLYTYSSTPGTFPTSSYQANEYAVGPVYTYDIP